MDDSNDLKPEQSRMGGNCALKELLAPLYKESRELALHRAGELGFSDKLASHHGVDWLGVKDALA